MFPSLNLATAVAPPANANSANALLAGLPAEDYARIAPQLRPLKLHLGEILHYAGAVVNRVYFVNSGMLSCVLTSDEGTDVEVGLVGHEGAACALSALVGDKSCTQVIVQASGDALFLSDEQLRAEFERGGAFQQRILKHAHVFNEQTSQVALCNRLHSVEERLARWLLMTQDRTGDKRLELTQEFIANMLGSRRAGVTLAAGVLKKAGLVDYARGKITILDRDGLEDIACECYDILHEHFQRALQ